MQQAVATVHVVNISLVTLCIQSLSKASYSYTCNMCMVITLPGIVEMVGIMEVISQGSTLTVVVVWDGAGA